MENNQLSRKEIVVPCEVYDRKRKHFLTVYHDIIDEYNNASGWLVIHSVVEKLLASYGCEACCKMPFMPCNLSAVQMYHFIWKLTPPYRIATEEIDGKLKFKTIHTTIMKEAIQ